MKKLVALILFLSLISVSLFSCGTTDDTQMRLGYMAGPTGMGMAKLIHDNGGAASGNEKYSFEKYTDTKLAQAALTAGLIDAICVPTNEAAQYYIAEDQNTVVLAINTLSTLFVLTDKNTTVNSFDDLNGKTVYTCKNGTPKIILESLIAISGLDIIVSTTVDGKEIASPAQLGEQVVAGKIEIAVVPEPIVTSSLLAIAKNGNKDIEYSVDLNLGDVWQTKAGGALAMGCIVASADFVSNHPSIVKAFLVEYKASIEFINNQDNLDLAAEYVVEAGVMQAVPVAKTAIKNLNGAIVYIDGKDMKNTLTGFYNAIGQALPDNGFYYEK